ncbi:MAG: hypothetical protein GC179_07080 [Anaerolineaceae bacterium]|nr:hypothetical protein [Anaerolineaceae bacterium]
MAVLREETRNRWSALAPDKFINTVLYGALGDQLKLAYTFIAVYTQIMHNLPRTQTLGLVHHQSVVELRSLLKQLRTLISDANNALHGDDTPTVPVSSYTDEGYILDLVTTIRRFIQEIERGVSRIETTPELMDIPMPGSNGRLASSVASDINGYMFEIVQILDFAQNYAQRILERTSHNPKSECKD